MNNGCFIPQKIKVGYQEREDTYSGKLAYVIYYDEKNKLRKETSWENWRDKKIDANDFENECLEGFVLNKKAGDYHGDWFSNRQAYIRVFDPRGFEIEITLNNLLYILENCDSIKGKGLSGRFCYGWSGTDLILLPECSDGYNESKKYTDTLYGKKKVKKSELKIGQTYIMRGNKKVVYLGYQNYFSKYGSYGRTDFDGTYYGKSHYFIDVDDIKAWNDKNAYHYFSNVENFKPVAASDEEYDCTNVMEELNNQIACSGKYRCYYTENEIKDALAKCKDGIYIWESGNVDRTFLKKISNDSVQYNRKSSMWYDHTIDLTVKDLIRGQYCYYYGNFVNGNLVSTEKYMEIK